MRWLHQTAPPKPKKCIETFDSRLTFSLLWQSMAKLYFYYSSMNAGKSTALLQSSYNYKERGMRTLVLAPDFDDRYGTGKVTSRIGIEAEAITFRPELDWLTVLESQRENRDIQVVCNLAKIKYLLLGQELCLVNEYTIQRLGLALFFYEGQQIIFWSKCDRLGLDADT